MNVGELISFLRSEIVGMNAELVSDVELIRYLDEGYKNFARLTGGFNDMDSLVTELDVEAGEFDVPLHPSILRINKAVRRSDGAEIKVIGYADVVNDDGLATLLRDTGVVTYLLMGVKPHYARWAPIPNANDVVDLIVERLPLKTLTSLTDTLSELDVVHHYSLLDFVKSRLFNRPGATFF